MKPRRRPAAVNRIRTPLVAFVASLLLAGVPTGASSGAAAASEGDRRFPYLVPAGDLDGDALSDVVSWELTPPVVEAPLEEVGERPLLTARRGRDGTVLWQQERPASVVQPTRLGPAGRDGVLVADGPITVWYEDLGEMSTFGCCSSNFWEDNISVDRRRLRVTALGGDGAVLWDREFAQGAMVDARSLGTSTSLVADLARYVGVLDATPSPAEDVLVAVVARQESPTERTTTLRLVVLDGADGREAASFSVTANGTRPTPSVVGDLDGDGADDVVIARSPRPTSFEVRSGRDGRLLWTSPELLQTYFSFSSFTDLGGDGGDELAVWTSGADWGDEPTRFVLDGATGAERISTSADRLEPVGDQDGDGRPELLGQDLRWGDEVTEVDYVLMDAEGRPLAERTFSHEIPPSWRLLWARLSASAGNLDGDPVPLHETGHQFAVDAEDSHQVPQGVVLDARTLEPLFEGNAGAPLFASLDGSGDDLLQVTREGPATLRATAQDGASGSALWAATLALDPSLPILYPSLQEAIELDGDGVPDVILNVQQWGDRDYAFGFIGSSAYHRVGWALSGRDGRLLWTA